ncbi:hypothetical protein GLOIN_2v1765605 [Rhizophagus clarus]|uniref:Uncharacterized protein n=1 Tax=Rhizophagus clarus TaxID=94130 RepID=A0A8H3LEZ0_9GLOM|nr:hypothetical protein GLOIN_2v1765605 [Rhizophagus clarus]
MTTQLIVDENTGFDAIYEQVQRASIMNNFFDTFMTLLDDQSFGWALKHSSLFAKDASKEEYQGYLGNFLPEIIKERLNKIADKRKYGKNLLYILYRASFLIHEDAFKTAATLYKDGGKIKDILADSDSDVSYDPNRLSDEFMDMEISINKEHQSQSSAASTSTNRNEDGSLRKQDKQKAKVVEQVIPDIPAPDPEPVVIPQPQVVPPSASSSSLKPTAKPFVSRTKGEKSKDKSNDLGDDATHIITGYRPNPSLGQYVRDIFIYDVPAKWENITLLDYLKVWGNVISVTIKKQKKYKTVRYKLEIMHAFDTWERDHLWIAPLGPVVVRWFPASWSLKERKERERFQAVVQGPPDSFTADALAVKEHLTNFINPLHIKAFKEVKNPDSTRKMIAYFESWEDLQNILSKESFWDGAKLSWCRHTVPSFITRRKGSQRSNSNRQDEPNKPNQGPPSKRTKTNSGSKTGSPATGSNHVPIRSPPKDSSQSSSGNKTGGKNKKSQKTKDKSTATSPPKKLSKRQLHAEIVEIKTVLMDFIRKQSQT